MSYQYPLVEREKSTQKKEFDHICVNIFALKSALYKTFVYGYIKLGYWSSVSHQQITEVVAANTILVFESCRGAKCGSQS